MLVSCGLLYLVLRDAWLAYALRGLPQPFGYPFVGHVPYLLKEPWRRFYDYSKQLGSVYAIRIFGKPIVVVSDPALVKTIFQGPNASNYIKDQWSYERFRCAARERGDTTNEGGEDSCVIKCSTCRQGAHMYWARQGRTTVGKRCDPSFVRFSLSSPRTTAPRTTAEMCWGMAS